MESSYERVKRLSVGIYKKFYLVSIPESQSMTSAQLRSRYENSDGSYSGHSSDRSRKHLCINSIAEYVEDGLDVRMEKASDRTVIYHKLQEYLEAWEDYRNQVEGHLSKNQLSHISSMDDLAHHIYSILGYRITEEIGLINKDEPLVNGGATHNFSKPKEKEEAADDLGREPPPGRIKFSKVFGIDEPPQRSFRR